jgi:hypothetical protein
MLVSKPPLSVSIHPLWPLFYAGMIINYHFIFKLYEVHIYYNTNALKKV